MRVYSAPGRVNILGNPTDGLEGAYAVISSAIDLRAYVYFGDKSPDDPFSDIDPGIARVFRGFTEVLKRYFPKIYGEFTNDSPRVNVRTEIPKASGLASSTALVAAFAYGLRDLYSHSKEVNDYVLAELITRGERTAGIECGYADRYVSVMGGLAYMDFRGKLFHKPLFEEPFATYERLDRIVSYIPLLIVYLSIPRDSGAIHKVFRRAYLREYMLWRKGLIERSEAKILNAMKRVGLTAIEGKTALLEEDWETFGKLMNINHKWVNYAMRLAGFKDGAGYYNNAVIRFALRKGALGAKLSGAGGGGSVLVLTEPDKEDVMKRELEGYLREIGLKSGKVFRFKISEKGTCRIS
ncbi:MAG: hypothetical protein DRJ51_02985 [Thermoprotei archaeon]|nr:MAG: hypothetical protein DRJ51_02985 [Thermoprotei archaeon]RLF02936.1 MAG: hypothetical protein DRJ59_02190 [Thermoprotei archaeon]